MAKLYIAQFLRTKVKNLQIWP